MVLPDGALPSCWRRVGGRGFEPERFQPRASPGLQIFEALDRLSGQRSESPNGWFTAVHNFPHIPKPALSIEGFGKLGGSPLSNHEVELLKCKVMEPLKSATGAYSLPLHRVQFLDIGRWNHVLAAAALEAKGQLGINTDEKIRLVPDSLLLFPRGSFIEPHFVSSGSSNSPSCFGELFIDIRLEEFSGGDVITLHHGTRNSYNPSLDANPVSFLAFYHDIIQTMTPVTAGNRFVLSYHMEAQGPDNPVPSILSRVPDLRSIRVEVEQCLRRFKLSKQPEAVDCLVYHCYKTNIDRLCWLVFLAPICAAAGVHVTLASNNCFLKLDELTDGPIFPRTREGLYPRKSATIRDGFTIHGTRLRPNTTYDFECRMDQSPLDFKQVDVEDIYDDGIHHSPELSSIHSQIQDLFDIYPPVICEFSLASLIFKHPQSQSTPFSPIDWSRTTYACELVDIRNKLIEHTADGNWDNETVHDLVGKLADAYNSTSPVVDRKEVEFLARENLLMTRQDLVLALKCGNHAAFRSLACDLFKWRHPVNGTLNRTFFQNIEETEFLEGPEGDSGDFWEGIQQCLRLACFPGMMPQEPRLLPLLLGYSIVRSRKPSKAIQDEILAELSFQSEMNLKSMAEHIAIKRPSHSWETLGFPASNELSEEDGTLLAEYVFRVETLQSVESLILPRVLSQKSNTPFMIGFLKPWQTALLDQGDMEGMVASDLMSSPAQLEEIMIKLSQSTISVFHIRASIAKLNWMEGSIGYWEPFPPLTPAHYDAGSRAMPTTSHDWHRQTSFHWGYEEYTSGRQLERQPRIPEPDNVARFLLFLCFWEPKHSPRIKPWSGCDVAATREPGGEPDLTHPRDLATWFVSSLVSDITRADWSDGKYPETMFKDTNLKGRPPTRLPYDFQRFYLTFLRCFFQHVLAKSTTSRSRPHSDDLDQQSSGTDAADGLSAKSSFAVQNIVHEGEGREGGRKTGTIQDLLLQVDLESHAFQVLKELSRIIGTSYNMSERGLIRAMSLSSSLPETFEYGTVQWDPEWDSLDPMSDQAFSEVFHMSLLNARKKRRAHTPKPAEPWGRGIIV
ncbi:hypothetical protein MKZ38_008704 [Zalerion maritima]|uniref:Uncharacterized protein n=1 Tax=Zalerion maritima TaxID=339359 RepID=A0AAD5RHB8_9PEZI|nr:hypothetical protein MKZ38_008704 [Zalerion maritima]